MQLLDIPKAETLISRGKITELLEYMLSHHCKLEQEIISWKDESL